MAAPLGPLAASVRDLYAARDWFCDPRVRALLAGWPHRALASWISPAAPSAEVLAQLFTEEAEETFREDVDGDGLMPRRALADVQDLEAVAVETARAAGLPADETLARRTFAVWRRRPVLAMARFAELLRAERRLGVHVPEAAAPPAPPPRRRLGRYGEPLRDERPLAFENERGDWI